MNRLSTSVDRFTRLVICIFSLASIFASFNGVDAVAHKWAIEPANVTYDEDTDIFTMKYGLDPSINETENLRVEILLPNCSYPTLGVEDGIVADYINASGYHIFEVHPQTMSSDDRLFNYSVWNNTNDANAVIKLCVHATLWTGPESDPDARQVSALETIVTLFIDLTEDFRIDGINIERQDQTENENIQNEDYNVFAYFCDPYTHQHINPSPVTAGQLLTICVEVTEETLGDGLYIDYIDQFVWIRNNTNGIADITQWVIQDGELTEPPISIYACDPPTIICDFSTFMWPVFFGLPGTAIGVGTAQLTFGDPDTNSTIRKARILWKESHEEQTLRELQELSSSTNGAFGLDLTILDSGKLPGLKTAAGVSLANPWRSLAIATIAAWLAFVG